MTARPPTDALASAGRLSPEALAAVGWLRQSARWTRNARLRLDSRQVQPGDVFVAAPGGKTDGRRFIAEAVQAGAGAVLWDPADGFVWPTDALAGLAEPGRGVANAALIAAHRNSGPIAAELLGHPSARMAITAFTGTNGKTTCSQWLAQLLESDGTPCAVVGTLGAGRFGPLENLTSLGLTTPEAVDLQSMLVDWTHDGLAAVSMEASSIGLAVGRLHGTQIKTAVFTNLTRDHLDFHPDFEAYTQAKAALFAWPGLASAVVNCDDAMADRMLEAAPSHVQRIGYRIDSKRRGVQASARVDAWLRVERIETLDSGGYRIEIDGDWGRGSVNLRAPGRFNISNALAVAGSALASGMGFEQVLVGLAKLSPVPGRMETLTERHAPLVVIDYAHTPDALIQVLAALRPIAKVRGGRLHCVFGAGGDRDVGKRALMGEAVAQHADTLMITTDNPRSEDPAQIVRAILEGVARVPSASGAQVDHDRRRAIQQVVGAAEAADVILIAGKGHESVQEIAGQQLPFRDVDEARLALSLRSDRAA